MSETTEKPHAYYLLEPILLSELVLINNAKKLKLDISLLNEANLIKIQELRDEYVALEKRSEQGEQGIQKLKKHVRDSLRDLSFVTYTDRDRNLFGQMITTMTQKIVTRPQFSNYTYKDEMQSLAIQYILLYTDKFDPYRQSKITNQYASAFAYISTIIFNACVATINKFNKEQKKAKEEFLETQKLIHSDPNQSTIGPEFEDAHRRIQLPNLTNEENELLDIMKSTTINEATEFWIPSYYRITEKEQDFVLKYEYNISIRRIK